MFIVTISGKAGSGKDTTGLIMQRIMQQEYYLSSVITHYGDAVKMVAEKYFGWGGEKDEKGRTLLQYIGNDKVRSYNPDLWVNFLMELAVAFCDKWDCMIIPDTRYRNEIEIPASMFSTYTVHVKADTPRIAMTEEQKQNPSETSLDDFLFGYEIDNNGTLETLEAQVRKVISSIYRKEYII